MEQNGGESTNIVNDLLPLEVKTTNSEKGNQQENIAQPTIKVVKTTDHEILEITSISFSSETLP